MQVTFPLDTTGTASTNLITNEQHSVTEANFRDFYFIIPTFAPFYSDNIIVTLTNQGVTKLLVKNIDYFEALPYLDASRSVGLPISGAIAFNNTITNGIITLQYQTLGGDWVGDVSTVLATLLTKAYNPRITNWDLVTNVQQVFPPTAHSHYPTDYVGYEDLVNALTSITSAITNKEKVNLLLQALTPDQVGLGRLLNLPPATVESLTTGIPAAGVSDEYVTLLTLKAYFQSANIGFNPSNANTMIDSNGHLIMVTNG